MCGEYWCGWFDHWYEDHHVREAEELAGRGIRAIVDGAVVCAGNTQMMEEAGAVPAETSGGTVIHVARDGAYCGCILIADSLREDAAPAMEALKMLGVRRNVMLSGDTAAVSEETAAAVGVDEYRSRLLPQDKVAAVEQLLANRRGKLAFVGDGVNDAPVLSRADIGIAMGAMGSDAAIEAADVVLMDDDPMKIVRAIRIARRCLAIVRQNIVFALGVKVLCLLLVAVGAAGMWLGIFADVGVMVLAVLNAMRALRAGGEN